MRIQLSDHFTYKKLCQFTLPSVAMMIFISIYSVVDGFFVSNFAGDIPFKAVNLIMPYLMITGTVGLLFGSGGTAIVASVYGRGDKEAANRYFSLFFRPTPPPSEREASGSSGVENMEVSISFANARREDAEPAITAPMASSKAPSA